MTFPTLCTPPGDLVRSALASAFAHGSATSVVLADGSGFGSPSAAAPVRFRMVRQSQLVGGLWTGADPSAAATYRCTGRSGNTLTGVTFESGTDQDFAAGDLCAAAVTARDFSDVHAHLRSGPVNVLSSGTVTGDGTTDDGPAVQAVIDAHPGRAVYFPRTATASDGAVSYYLGSTTLTLSHGGATLFGDGGGYQSGTILKWAAKTTGVWLTSAGNCVRDLCLFGSEPWAGVHYDEGIVPAGRYTGLTVSAGASDADGVRVAGPYNRLLRLNIQYFGRDAVNASAGDQALGVGYGAEDCQFDSLFVGNNRGSGVRFQGGDANCGQVNGTTAFVNQQWGFDASAFLAGSWISPQATNNGQDSSEQLSGAGDATQGVLTMVRSGNTVTLTFALAYSTVLRPGDGVRVIACPADPSFVGRFRVLTVNGPKTVVTYTQVAADASTSVSPRAVASVVRVAAVATVTLTWSSPLTSPAARPGDWLVVQSCTDSSFLGEFKVLTVAADNSSLTYQQLTGGDTAVAGGTTAVTGPTTSRANFLPPDGVISSAVRASNVVTLTFPAAYLTVGGGYAAAAGSPFKVGQGVSLLNCPDASFNGTFVVLSVSNGNRTVTYAQTGSNATIASGTARMAIPFDTWQLSWTPPDNLTTPDQIWGGGINAPSGAAPQAWLNPYVEGGQRIRFGRANVAVAPTWSDPLDSTWANGVGLVIYGTGPGTQTPATNLPVGVVWANDIGVNSLTRIGLTAPQLHNDYFQHPVTVNGAATTFWTLVRGPNEYSLWHGDPATGTPKLRQRFDNSAGYTYLNSEGGGMVRVNADSGTGTGGLVVGDGGGTNAVTITGKGLVLTPVADSAAANGSLYLGSDHGGKFCRKDGAGVVHVLAESP